MSDPVSLLLAASGGISAVSSITQGQQEYRAAKRRSRLLQEDARRAQQEGALDAEFALEEARRIEGAALAEGGASGFTLDGTVEDALAALARSSAIDGQMARYEGNRRAYGLDQEAMETWRSGRQSLVNGYLNATSTLLSTGAQIGQRAE